MTNWKRRQGCALPGAKSLDGKSRPTVFVSTTPAEMHPARRASSSYVPVAGTTELLWVQQHGERSVFRLGRAGPVRYYLVAGRWFSAPDFTGPWTFATTVAARRDSGRFRSSIHVRACSPAVPERRRRPRRCLLAQMPQTARVKKKELKAPEVDASRRAEVRADPT